MVAQQADNTASPARGAARSPARRRPTTIIARAVAADPTLAGTLHVLPQFEVAA